MALTAAAFECIDPRFIGAQPIHTTSTTQMHQLGTRIKVKCPTYGPAEAIYLKGVASTARNDAVVFNADDYTTVRTVAESIGHMAVAQSANVASQYGWYIIAGSCPVKAATVSDNGAVYTTATASQLDDLQADSQQVIGAKFASATDTGLAEISLLYPFAGANDQVD